MKKYDYKNDFKNVISYYFSVEEMYNYELKKLPNNIIDKLKKYISEIENSEDYFTYYRGTDFNLSLIHI